MSATQPSMDRKLVIILSTVIPALTVLLVSLAVCLWVRRRRRGTLFNRGITPIGDDEIETWKSRPLNEKQAFPSHHTPSPSTSSLKSPSVIQYQSSTRPSLDLSSPAPILRSKVSLDFPQVPGSAVLARAPNARSGLTDETVPGDEPFVESLRRQPSRLSKRQPIGGRASFEQRGRSSRCNSLKTLPEYGSHGKSLDLPRQVRHSSEGPRKAHSRIYSSSSIPPVLSSSGTAHFSALSPPPPPSRGGAESIGRAIG